MIKTREKLILLLENANYQCENRDCDEDAEGCEYHRYANCWAQFIADHLIANGVTFTDDRPRFFVKTNQKCIEDLVQIIGSGTVVLSVGEESIIPIHPGRWIPVAERLPEEYSNVLIRSLSGWIGTAMYTANGVFEEAGLRVFVTHWMPLPEPPKGE